MMGCYKDWKRSPILLTSQSLRTTHCSHHKVSQFPPSLLHFYTWKDQIDQKHFDSLFHTLLVLILHLSLTPVRLGYHSEIPVLVFMHFLFLPLNKMVFFFFFFTITLPLNRWKILFFFFSFSFFDEILFFIERNYRFVK